MNTSVAASRRGRGNGSECVHARAMVVYTCRVHVYSTPCTVSVPYTVAVVTVLRLLLPRGIRYLGPKHNHLVYNAALSAAVHAMTNNDVV